VTLRIELKPKEEPHSKWNNAVMHFFKDCPARQFNFKDCDFRINGQVFTERTEEFIKVVEQDAIMEALKHGV